MPVEALRALAAAQAGREQHALAGLHAPAELALFDHFAGDVAAQDVRHGESHAGDALAQPEVEVVQRAGAHADQDLVGADLGVRGVFVDQHLGPAVLVDPCSLHVLCCSAMAKAMRATCISCSDSLILTPYSAALAEDDVLVERERAPVAQEQAAVDHRVAHAGSL